MAVTNKYRHTNTALCHYWFYGHPSVQEFLLWCSSSMSEIGLN